jgi:NADPH-dependent 2,4-dienoyl-CoA reductase/sulfur reductase-like enzyme/rhodanese-related sulfurtransferase
VTYITIYVNDVVSLCHNQPINLQMKYVIIGAVAGGASTAARLRRMDEHAEIVIFEKGEYISYANCGLPYYIGDIIKDRNQLFVQTAASFKSRFNIDVRITTEVTAIDTINKNVTAINLTTLQVYTESFDKLVLAPGAEPIRPPLPGIGLDGIFTLRNVSDTDYIKEYVSRNNMKKAVVIGAGFIGLEMAENLHSIGLKVCVVEMGNQVLANVDYPIAALLQQHLRSKGISLKLLSTVTGFEKDNDKLNVLLKDQEALNTDIVILSIGVKPDTRLAAKAGLDIGAAKGILVNEFLQTSNPDVYAVGDAIEFTNPISGVSMPTYLAGPANKQGRIVANNIAFGNNHKYKGAINTAIVKVFDLTAGCTGLSVKQLKASNIPHLTATVHGNSHAGYYPGAQLMAIQIAFSPDTGKLLGGQIVGGDGVDKRIDVLSALIKTGGTIDDLTEFEQAYAPPFSSAKDPLNMAAFTAENILSGRLKVIDWSAVDNREEDSITIDVRTSQEFASETIDCAVNIPVDEMRDRLNEIEKNKTIYIFCQQGLRGYIAQRILLQSGFNEVYNIAGGYLLYNASKSEQKRLMQFNQLETQ